MDVFQPPGKIWYEDPWQRSITKEMADNSCIVRTERVNTDSQNANEKIEFKLGRKPKEAIEGDLIRFMYNDYDNNSVSWVQGRLTSRIDNLDDAVDSEWTMNRFRVDNIIPIANWGNPKSPPSSTIVNINYYTKWLLGIRNDQLNGITDRKNQKLYLGYYEATS